MDKDEEYMLMREAELDAKLRPSTSSHSRPSSWGASTSASSKGAWEPKGYKGSAKGNKSWKGKEGFKGSRPPPPATAAQAAPSA